MATKFALTVNVSEFMLAIGRTRIWYSAEGGAEASATEYQTAHSMSPSAAKQLALVLSTSIRQYEEKFGPITEDPELTRRLATMTRKPLKAALKGGKVVPIKLAAKKPLPKKR